MFGLSTKEVELKNVYAAFSNCANVYYNAIKSSMNNADLETESEQQEMFRVVRKEYFNKSRETLFTYLRTQYRNFDLSFENAIKSESSYFSSSDIQRFLEDGFNAGVLYYYVIKAITRKEVKTSDMQLLNYQVNEIMNKVLEIIDNE